MLEAGVYPATKSLDQVEVRVRNIIGAQANHDRLRTRLMRESIALSGEAAVASDIQRGTRLMPGEQGRPHQVYRVLKLTDANRQLMAEDSQETQENDMVITWEKVTPLEDQA